MNEAAEKPQDILEARFWLGFGATMLVAILTRFWDLAGAPIAMDEGVSMAFARLPFDIIMFNQIDNHPPGSFLIQALWHDMAPDAALARVPSAVQGILAVAVMMLMMRDQTSARAALFAGAIFAVATGHIFYSQDARMYPMLVLGLTLATWGALGHSNPSRLSPRAYIALYVIGGAFAIYAHMLGLVTMALIGGASLAAGLLNREPDYVRSWLKRNIILFFVVLPWLVQLPSAMGTFPGLAGERSLLDAPWFYRNMTGFPGLGGPSFVIELLLYGSCGLAAPFAWMSGRRGLAIMLAGLIVIFPLMILALDVRQPILSNKIMLPAVIGVVFGAGYTLSKLQRTGLVMAGILVLAGLLSSANMLGHHNKMEDYPAAFAIADREGFTDAPVISCNHFMASAIWETRPEAKIYTYRQGETLHYKGPEYFQAMRVSMSKIREATHAEIDAILGGGWLVQGGLEKALEDNDKVVFIRPFCPNDKGQDIEAELETLGFTLRVEALARGRAPEDTILETPQTKIGLYER